ncbi:hypothetical protein [Sphingomonas cavernae]|uniref:Uncharacterized protein n=1 Tax=Sphingomonas cavernae TaxID=2320861 RepID=A0A418WRW1_9SPHN|nr:hypothetical protein [Sphingomonas cavernae]RJF93961.1 hypothetical protein D3876_06735 [Sphingomonas cavernae]
MARKDKTAKGGKTVKGKKADRLPKEIGGMKIPKTLRKDGEKLIALLKHPLVAEMAAAGLMAFAREMRAGKDGEGGQSGSGAPAEEARVARKSAGKTLGDLAQVAAILGTVLAARTGGNTRH